MSPYQTPDHTRRAFARTNPQTIAQRVALLTELLPHVRSIAEICCGDCSEQWQQYRAALALEQYTGLDLDPRVVETNRARGIHCLQGDALNPQIMRTFLPYEVIFFGPPLSQNCDGHTLLGFHQVVPGFAEFTRLMFRDLRYQGILICIAPNETTLGDVRWLYHTIRTHSPQVNLRLAHYSITTLTGTGETTEPRLKYVDIWLSPNLENRWEFRISDGGLSSL